MFNQYLELTPENADIAMINVVLEDLKFIVLSLDHIFHGYAKEGYCKDGFAPLEPEPFLSVQNRMKALQFERCKAFIMPWAP